MKGYAAPAELLLAKPVERIAPKSAALLAIEARQREVAANNGLLVIKPRRAVVLPMFLIKQAS